MSDPIDTGGPAFPQPLAFSPDEGVAHTTGEYFHACGITMRDYFAAAALTGMQSNWYSIESYLRNTGSELGGNAVREFMAFAAYAQADAMLKAREESE